MLLSELFIGVLRIIPNVAIKTLNICYFQFLGFRNLGVAQLGNCSSGSQVRLQSNVSWGSSHLKAALRLEDPVAKAAHLYGCRLEVCFSPMELFLGLFTACSKFPPE